MVLLEVKFTWFCWSWWHAGSTSPHAAVACPEGGCKGMNDSASHLPQDAFHAQKKTNAEILSPQFQTFVVNVCQLLLFIGLLLHLITSHNLLRPVSARGWAPPSWNRERNVKCQGFLFLFGRKTRCVLLSCYAVDPKWFSWLHILYSEWRALDLTSQSAQGQCYTFRLFP